MKTIISFVISFAALVVSICFFGITFLKFEEQKKFIASIQSIQQLHVEKNDEKALTELSALSNITKSNVWEWVRILKIAYVITIKNNTDNSDYRLRFLNFCKSALEKNPNSELIKAITSYSYILNLDYDSAFNTAREIRSKKFDKIKLIIYLKLNVIPKKSEFKNVENFDEYMNLINFDTNADSWEKLQELVLSYLDRDLIKEAYKLIQKNKSTFKKNNPLIFPYVAYDMGKYQESADAIKEVLSDNADLYALLGDINFIKNDIKESLKDYQIAARLEPKLSIRIYNNIIWISKYLKIKSFNTEKLILNALKYFPDNKLLFINYINYLIETNQITKASEYLNKNSLSREKETVKLLSAILHKKQDANESKFILRLWDIIDNDNDVEDTAKILAFNLLKGNDLKGLGELILFLKDKQYNWLNLYIGFEKLLSGDVDGAEDLWQTYSIGVFQPDMAYNLAVLYVKKNNYDEAIKLLNSIERYLKSDYLPFLNKDNNRYSKFITYVYYLYAYIHRASGEYQLALEDLDNAMGITKTNVMVNELYTKVRRDLEKKYYEIGE